jgi:hypothetical protein
MQQREMVNRWQAISTENVGHERGDRWLGGKGNNGMLTHPHHHNLSLATRT